MSGPKGEIDLNYSFDFFYLNAFHATKFQKRVSGAIGSAEAYLMNLQSMGYCSSENNDPLM